MSDKHDEFLAVLVKHLSAVREPAEIDRSRNLRMLGLNSMRAVDLVIDLEEALDFVFPDNQFTDETFETADSLWRTVQANLAPAASV